jgi:AAA domain
VRRARIAAEALAIDTRVIVVARAIHLTDDMSNSAQPNVMRLADYLGDTRESVDAAPAVKLLTLDQLRAQAGSVKWLVKHVIPSESVGLFFGASGTFKSFVAIDLALHIAHGIPWLGKKTTQGPVLIIAAEGGVGLWRRIVAWHRTHNLTWKGAPVYVIPTSINLAADAILVREAAQAAGITPALVVIDTLAQTFSGEENSSQEVGVYLREIGLQFRECWQCAVVIVHHTGHVATERPRGSSALHAAVDFMFGVFRDEKEMLATISCSKQKDGELPLPASFAMRVVELARDEDGDPVTSLVARAIGSTDEMLDLMQSEATKGRGGKQQLLLQLVQNGMKEKELRTVFYERCEGDADMKRKAYYRARKAASDSGFIEIAEDVVIDLRA